MQEMLDKKKTEPALWVCVVMLFLAIPSGWPDGYYTLLRWVVCLTTGYLAYEDYRQGRKKSPVLLGAIAVLFNPIVPIHLSKADWAVADFVIAVILIFYGLRGKALRLNVGKKTRRNLIIGAGVCILALGLWIAWSQHRYSTHDYPIYLVSSQANFHPEQHLKSIQGELTVHGWQVKPAANVPDTYLVSFTYSTPPGRILQALQAQHASEMGPSQPTTRGWWWEVNTSVPLVRPVIGDPILEKRYGLLPSNIDRKRRFVLVGTALTSQELSEIHLSGEIKEESHGVWMRYLLLTIHNGTGKPITDFRVSITFYDGNFLVSERHLPRIDSVEKPARWFYEVLHPGSTGKYKVDISEIYPNTQVTRFELKLLEALTRP